jgi:hypothetical protein
MSLTRRIRRAQFRKNGKPWPTRERTFIVHDDGGYSVLRPTKGWIHVCAARVRLMA